MSNTVFIDSTTGELKYQGDTGTPGVLADGNGNVPFSSSIIHFPLLSGVVEIDTGTFTSVGSVVFDPSSIFSGNGKITRTIEFKTLLHATSGVTAEVRLYNLTSGAEVADTLMTSSDTSPTSYSSTLTVGSDILNFSVTYEIQLRIESPEVISPGDYAMCSSASIVVTYS